MSRSKLIHAYQRYQKIFFLLLFPIMIAGVIIIASLIASGTLDTSCSSPLGDARVRIGDSNAGTPLASKKLEDDCFASWQTEDLLVSRDGNFNGTFIMKGPRAEDTVAGDFLFVTIEAHYAAPFFGQSTSVLVSDLIPSVAYSSSEDGAVFHVEGPFREPSSRDKKVNTLDCIDLNFTGVRIYEMNSGGDTYAYQVFAASSAPYVERAPLVRFNRTSGLISGRFVCYEVNPENRLGDIVNARWPTLMPVCQDGSSCAYLQWIKERVSPQSVSDPL